MGRSLLRLMALVVVVLLAATPAYAHPSTGARGALSEVEGQGGSSSATLNGVVVDTGGGIVPGATVVVKDTATGREITVVSNSTGAFSVPSLNAGTYIVTVSLSGFKTQVINDVRLLAATTQSVKATLEVGNLAETVEVRGNTTLVNTQTNTVSSTMSVEAISNLPLVSRNALNAVTFLPGVETIGGPRGSTISGLPQNTINITIDGITTSNLLQGGDGFFSLVTPRLDAVEEVTVTGATPGSDRGGGGSVNIAFVTRSGSNRYDASIYHYFRHPSLNTNYWFNVQNGLDRNEVIVHQYGGRLGGPIVIPGVYDGRGKAFFFFNYEHFFQPTEVTRTRTMFNPQAQQGFYTYTAGGVTRSINVLALAQQNGQLATTDPTVAGMLAKIRSGAESTGNINTPVNALNTNSYIYQADSRRNEWAPTTRLDYNVSSQHRLTGTYYWQRFHSNPDILNGAESPFPGLLNYGIQASYRTTGSVTLRSTLSPNVVNEIKGGWQWSPVDFYGNVTRDMFSDQNYFQLGFAGGPNNTDFSGLTGPTAVNSPQPRNTVNWNIDSTLNWLRGSHSWTMGASFIQVRHDQNFYSTVPTIAFGVDTTNDPAAGMFTTANFPNASNNQLSMARHLYAVMTGRVTSIGGTARLDSTTDEFVYLGNLNQKSRMNEFGLFAQDSWRITPTVTLNYGARWEMVLPFVPTTPNWTMATMADVCGISGVGSGPGGRQCNLFQPGNLAGAGYTPTFTRYDPGSPGYETDWNNVAPNVGIAWRPNVQDGWLRRVLGDPDQATVRAGYAISYNRERMDQFTGVYGDNPGATTSGTRNVNNGNLVYPGETWPVLFRDSSRLGPPAYCSGAVTSGCIPVSPTFPFPATSNNSVNIFDPTIKVPFTESWSVGWQRALGRDMAFEVRYVGNRNRKAWTTEDWNDINIFENNFLDEFGLAQQNLRAHVAQGCGTTGQPACSFAYRGPNTGTQPLPIYLAYFQGLDRNAAQSAASYTSGNFTNSDWTGHLGQYEPDPFDAANDLHGNATRRSNAIAAGLAPNFFVMNPAVGGANVTVAAAGSRYHSMQFDLRRRLSRGLTAQFNYTYARRWGSSLQDLHRDRFYIESANVPHAFKGSWVYEVPVGRGRRFGTDMNPILDTIVGGWEYSGTGRVQWRQFSTGGIKLFGMSREELQDNMRLRIVKSATGATTVFDMPEDIITNTRRAFNTSPTTPSARSRRAATSDRRAIRAASSSSRATAARRIRS
jgi:Carboxypeptidase regulatory-like domain